MAEGAEEGTQTRGGGEDRKEATSRGGEEKWRRGGEEEGSRGGRHEG